MYKKRFQLLIFFIILIKLLPKINGWNGAWLICIDLIFFLHKSPLNSLEKKNNLKYN
jgi:hypothetical protein